MAGLVYVAGQKAAKAGQQVPQDAEIEVRGGEKFVGRGGLKMEGALDYFRIDPTGRIAVDVGASTGGFTDCLLQRGALRVHALDVGHGQLDWSLRNDPGSRSTRGSMPATSRRRISASRSIWPWRT